MPLPPATGYRVQREGTSDNRTMQSKAGHRQYIVQAASDFTRSDAVWHNNSGGEEMLSQDDVVGLFESIGRMKVTGPGRIKKRGEKDGGLERCVGKLTARYRRLVERSRMGPGVSCTTVQLDIIVPNSRVLLLYTAVLSHPYG